ncbi:hypothetical protein CERSUDRAFT_112455 [Gelatoporia subvermispora B]|uniref:Carbohydrate-binding module family 19 domain-containing protein n=1 Tax=Ceriporiopsis subvermispora (strain B) TaxID=914234 RepID=M2PQA7_CERS8|nr:hypothetical protein CERSUDRAFT_112455 [Gelatoporia subvermispora B]
MVHFASTVALAVAALSMQARGLPLNKRIAQVIADSTTKWEAACDAAGGGEQCNPISVTAFSTLLAAAGPCDQQNSADAMVDLAKQLNNDADMITFAQIFAQQPRNSPSSQAVPYCQEAPKNAELNGLFQCQFQSADEQTFVGGIPVGGNGTIPFGMTSPVSPAGSCPANPSGPITDGSQLTDITSNPGVPGASNSSSSSSSASTGSNNGASGSSAVSASAAPASASATDSATAAAPSASDSGDDSGDDSDCDDGDDDGSDASSSVASATAAPIVSTAAAAMPSASAPASSSSSTSSGSFQLQNGQDAQAQNAKFATLSTTSSCNEGDMACINNGFAQCVSGQFVVEGCSSGTICAALPLVNKPGTSIACTTQSDALSRIAATGAQGGLTGSNSTTTSD